jgi:hypothetical protein
MLVPRRMVLNLQFYLTGAAMHQTFIDVFIVLFMYYVKWKHSFLRLSNTVMSLFEFIMCLISAFFSLIGLNMLMIHFL